MKPSKKNGRLLGFLFLVITIIGGAGTTLRALSNPVPDTAAFLNNILEKTSQMQLAIGLDMLGRAIAVCIAIFLFPLMKKFSHRLALSYFGIAIASFVIITVSNIIHIGLLQVAADFSISNIPDAQHYTTLSKMLYESYYWTHFLMLILYSIGGIHLFYFLFKTQIIPKWLAIWGILANCVVFIGGALQIMDITVSFYLFIQNGIFILAFIGWLLIVGFKERTTKTF